MQPVGKAPPFETLFGRELDGFPAVVLPETGTNDDADGPSSLASDATVEVQDGATDNGKWWPFGQSAKGVSGELRQEQAGAAPLDPKLPQPPRDEKGAAAAEAAARWEWPDEWRDKKERAHCLRFDFELSLAVRFNSDDEAFALTIDSTIPCLPPQLLKLALKACVLRARARCWFHLRRRQLRIALHEGEDLVLFKSFADLGVLGCCCCGACPDRAGITSRIVRHYLRGRITAQTPVIVDLPYGVKGRGGKDGELQWTSTLSGIEYRIPIPCDEQ